MVERWEEDVDEALRGLNDAVPEMDARAFAAGRARLRAATGSPPLAHAGPPEPDAVVVALAPQPRRRSPPLRKAAPWLAVAAAVAVVAVGAIALQRGEPDRAGTTAGSPSPGPTTTDPAPPSTASGAPNPRIPTGPDGKPITDRPGPPLPPMPDKPLNAAGDLAATASDLTLRPGQYLYRRAELTQAGDDNSPGGAMTLEQWVPQDHNLEWMERQESSGNIQGGNPDGPLVTRKPGAEFWAERQSPWSPSPENLASLPRDPAALYEKVRTEVNAPMPNGTMTTNTAAFSAFTTLTHVFAYNPHVPADLRAALLRTVGYLPGVVITKDVRLADGRTATAIGHELEQYRHDILIDPATGRAIGDRNVALEDFQGYHANQAFTSSVATDAVVDKIGQRPTG